MNISAIKTYNNFHRYDYRNNEKITAKSVKQNSQTYKQISSFNNPKAAEAISNTKLSTINFTGHVENILIWKPSHSDNVYNAKLEYTKDVYSGPSADIGVFNAIRNSDRCDYNARIVGHVENTDIDYHGPQSKIVYFSDPNERIFNGIKYSYDYVVYAPGAFDDGEEYDTSGAYDTVSDWESFGWIDPLGPSWL